MSNGLNIGSLPEQIFAPDSMEWEESQYAFLTGLLKREGGDTLTTDTGGLTKYGISTKAHGKQGYDIANLTEAEARTIYEEQYIPEAVNRIGKNNVTWKFVDMIVNMGWGNATSVLQESLGMEKDGKFGPGTEKKIKQVIDAYGEDEVISMLSEAQLKYYKELQESDPEKYGAYKGWTEGPDARYKYNPIKG